MINPSEINAVAERHYEENLRFREFLKEHADSNKLDAQFFELHNELFSDYDCCKCANCCKAYAIVLSDEDIERISKHLGQDKKDFIEKNLEVSFFDESEYKLKIQPCMFLNADGKCSIQDVKPADCWGFPFTDKPGRLECMLGVIDFAEECPVVFEILERLKAVCGFNKNFDLNT